MKPILTLLLALAFSCVHAQPLKVYFGNLHSHTSYSDGSSTPDAAYKHARDVAKVDFLAITEHNHEQAGGAVARDNSLYSGTAATSLISRARQFNQDNKFIAIYGQEFSTIGSGNHANVFEINKVIKTSLVPNGRWDKLFNEFLPQFRDAQGRLPLMVLNHPAIAGSPNNKEYGRDDYDNFEEWLSKLDSCAELINMVNGPSHNVNGSPGKPSEKEFLRYLNMGLHVGPTADQDNHKKNWGDAADTRTAVITTSLTKKNILEALRARNVYATEDRNLSVIATFNGQLIGTRITGNQVPVVNSPITIELTVKDKDEPGAFYTIDVYADTIGGTDEADVIHEMEFEGDTTIVFTDVKYTGGNQYFFIKITQTDDDGEIIDHAWLAPVWFERGGPTPAGPETPLLTLRVNERTEEAEITNIGSRDIDLKNFKLVSTVGNQEFVFVQSRIVRPGESVIVTSGPNGINTGNKILWTTNYIWSNAGDPGRLLDPEENIIATTSQQ